MGPGPSKGAKSPDKGESSGGTCPTEPGDTVTPDTAPSTSSSADSGATSTAERSSDSTSDLTRTPASSGDIPSGSSRIEGVATATKSGELPTVPCVDTDVTTESSFAEDASPAKLDVRAGNSVTESSSEDSGSDAESEPDNSLTESSSEDSGSDAESVVETERSSSSEHSSSSGGSQAEWVVVTKPESPCSAEPPASATEPGSELATCYGSNTSVEKLETTTEHIPAKTVPPSADDTSTPEVNVATEPEIPSTVNTTAVQPIATDASLNPATSSDEVSPCVTKSGAATADANPVVMQPGTEEAESSAGQSTSVDEPDADVEHAPRKLERCSVSATSLSLAVTERIPEPAATVCADNTSAVTAVDIAKPSNASVQTPISSSSAAQDRTSTDVSSTQVKASTGGNGSSAGLPDETKHTSIKTAPSPVGGDIQASGEDPSPDTASQCSATPSKIDVDAVKSKDSAVSRSTSTAPAKHGDAGTTQSGDATEPIAAPTIPSSVPTTSATARFLATILSPEQKKGCFDFGGTSTSKDKPFKFSAPSPPPVPACYRRSRRRTFSCPTSCAPGWSASVELKPKHSLVLKVDGAAVTEEASTPDGSESVPSTSGCEAESADKPASDAAPAKAQDSDCSTVPPSSGADTSTAAAPAVSEEASIPEGSESAPSTSGCKAQSAHKPPSVAAPTKKAQGDSWSVPTSSGK
ncbi:uncharacterized protein LOC144159801 [Haemaphysalis longicornis]